MCVDNLYVVSTLRSVKYKKLQTGWWRSRSGAPYLMTTPFFDAYQE